MILYMGVVLYAPAIALNQVMEIDIIVSIFVTGAVCTFYTAIGGLKAVMWTDAFQMIIVFSGIMAVLVKGTMEVGGFETVWETAKNGSKIQLDNFSPSPLERHTFWTLVFGGFVTSMTIYASNQAMIQRYLSMETKKKAQTALYLQLPASIIFTTLLVYAGLVLYARYHDDDPLASCTINKRDQLIPWLVMDVLGQYHGFPGLMVACIFSASLSTVSSGVNALALVFLTDIVKPLYKFKTGQKMTERAATISSKIFAITFGAITIGLAFLAQKFGSLILQVALSIFGMVGGPLLGLFVAALFFPVINEWGAFIGVLSSLSITSWVAIGSIIYRSNHASPNPCQHSGDNVINTTTQIMMTQMTSTSGYASLSTAEMIQTDSESDSLSTLYQLSYMWYSSLAVTVVLAVGLLVSCLTGGTKRKPVDPRLLSPWYHKLSSLGRVIPLEQQESVRENGIAGKTSIKEISDRDIRDGHKHNRKIRSEDEIKLKDLNPTTQ